MSIILICFIFYPILNISIYGIYNNSSFFASSERLIKGLKLLNKSLLLSITTTIISIIIGFIAAFTLGRIKFKGRKILKILILTPLINPPFVGSIAYIMLFGKRGLITNKLLGLSISPFGFKGIVIMQCLSSISLAYILISSAVDKIDPSLEEAARNIGASEWIIFKTITFKTMLPEITNTSLLIFLSSMADFSTPIIIGGPYRTLAAQLYIEITGLFDLKTGALLGALLLIPCLLAFILQRHIVNKRLYFTDRTRSENVEHKRINPLVKYTLIIITTLYIILVCIKYIFILIGGFTVQWGQNYSFTLDHFKYVFTRDFTPFKNSIKLAFVTASLSSLLGVFLSYLIYRKDFKTSKVIDFIATLPAAVPGILYGMSYLVSFNKKPLILIGTKIVIYIICITRFINIALRTGYALLSHMDPNIELASFNLGMGEIGTFTQITLPQLKPAFLSSFIKNFSSGMITLGAIILLMIPSNKVAVQMIFISISGSTIGTAAAMSLLLSFTNIALLGLFYIIFNVNNIFKTRRDKVENSI